MHASTDLAKLEASIRRGGGQHLYLSKRLPHARIRVGSSTPHDATRTLQPRRQLPPSLQRRIERAGRGGAGRGGEIEAGACAGYSSTRAGDRGEEIGGSWRRGRQRRDGEGGDRERQGDRSFLTGGGEGDGHLMPLCHGTCSATEFTVLPPNT